MKRAVEAAKKGMKKADDYMNARMPSDYRAMQERRKAKAAAKKKGA